MSENINAQTDDKALQYHKLILWAFCSCELIIIIVSFVIDMDFVQRQIDI